MDQDNNSSNFEFNAAYNDMFDLRKTNLDDDGADSFFDVNINIKEEIMSPILASPALDGTFNLWSNDGDNIGLDETMRISEANSSESHTPVLSRSRRRSTSESSAVTDKVSDNDPSVNSQLEVEDLNNALKHLKLSVMRTPLRKSVKFDGLALLLPREKDHNMVTRQDAEQKTPKLDLRSRSITRSADNIDNIRNEPFENTRKRKISLEVSGQTQRQKFMSMAEQIRHFQNDTPDRFRSKPKGIANMNKPSGRPTVHYEPRPTIPHSPPLQSQLRMRPLNHLTRAEEEELEVEEIKKFKMKAVPFNKKVFHTPNLGKRVEIRPPTKIEPFKLTDVKKKEMPDKPTYKFTARPVPKTILEKPTGIGEKHPAKLTDPKTPSFIQRNKTSARGVAPVIDEDDENLATKEIFHFGVPCKRATPRKAQRRSTIVQPFSFEERDKMMMIRKQETIQKYLEDEKKAREFHANPLPGTLSRKTSTSSIENDACVLPNYKSYSLLLNDGYAAKRQEKIKKQLEGEAAQLRRDTAFKARPAVVLTQKPFIVKKSATPLKELPVFELNTERRAKEREEYEKKIKEKEDQLKECMRQRKLLEDKEEKEAIAKMRLAAVHKAKPAPNVNKFEVHLSEKPLTDPQSPRFTDQSSPISPVLSIIGSSFDVSE